ncbi:SIS domain-containing protein [Sphingomonas sp. LM7]|uniref:SIS domain-containing protein n=1 Tax=Sphingomonas sp. LM7 TaxID=1938607 RepID=UPI000983DEF2|nr:SIS domain-containing protein [Sphingomonas sp. LM7]AQR75056.1 sugar isomerase [Sphingomonas sp. LM7]
MTTYLGLTLEEAAARGAKWTSAEIVQQPETLRQTAAGLAGDTEARNGFLAPLLANPDLRIILSGAGTSAFIGESLAPLLSLITDRCIEAVATTDIVAGPRICLRADQPTLMVSFGRSGNSPESVAAIDLADQLIDDVHHLVITCNADGMLARYAGRSERAFAIVLPDATHDRSFAMTSSFTAMLYAALAALGGAAHAPVALIADAVARTVGKYAPLAADLGKAKFERAVYLGCGGFTGIAREGALKLLEMTDGATAAIHDTPLGFRHGPKTFLNGRTLVVLFVPNDPHARAYALDLLDELSREGTAQRVLAVTTRPIEGRPAADQVVIDGLELASDLALLFPYIVVAQMIGLWQALALGKTPDNPNPAGIVNRVVQGVRIHAIA